MEDLKAESVDFVKEFQEYLTQQTQHVNMISGSVCSGENNPGDSFQAGDWRLNNAHICRFCLFPLFVKGGGIIPPDECRGD